MNPGQLVELDLMHLLCARVRGRTMVDVGAQRGFTLAPFLDAGFDVHAFEPVEQNVRVLEERTAGRPNLSLWPNAVSDSPGTKAMRLAETHDGEVHQHFHSLERLEPGAHHRAGETVEVECVTLDDLIGKGELPASTAVLKIDTEGHDLAVLRGAAMLASEATLVEFWGPDHPLGTPPSPAEQMVDLMASRGHRDYIVIEHLRGATEFHHSTLEALDPASWGNIVFFADGESALYEEVVRRCGRPFSPLERLLLRELPGRDDLCFIDASSRGDLSAEVLDVFPASRELTAGDSGPDDASVSGRAGLDLLKIAARGDGAEALGGCERTIAESRPVVIVEATFARLDAAQGQPHEIFSSLAGHGYRLARIFNVHHTALDELAFCDLAFVPSGARDAGDEGPFSRVDEEAESGRQLREKLRAQARTIEDLRGRRERLKEIVDEQRATLERLEANGEPT